MTLKVFYEYAAIPFAAPGITVSEKTAKTVGKSMAYFTFYSTFPDDNHDETSDG